MEERKQESSHAQNLKNRKGKHRRNQTYYHIPRTGGDQAFGFRPMDEEQKAENVDEALNVDFHQKITRNVNLNKARRESEGNVYELLRTIFPKSNPLNSPQT